jgi:uncharacterized membrane protein
MEKIKLFFKTTLLGGILVILPIFILILVFNWIYKFVIEQVRPLVEMLVETVRLHEFVASILAIIITLLVCFAVGLIVKTRLGKFTFEIFEKNFLHKLPFYKIIKETVIQLVGSDKNIFKSVALVNLFGNETLVTAFVTEEHKDGSFTIFVPSGPAPTAGFIYHLKKEYVHVLDYPIEKGMKIIFSLGAGSDELLTLYKNSKVKGNE